MVWLLMGIALYLGAGCSGSTTDQPGASPSAAPRDTASVHPASATPAHPAASLLQPLSSDQLTSLLPAPERFPELASAFPPTSGRQVFSDGSVITRASREYRFRNGGYLWISVSDYAGAPTQLQREVELIRNPAKDYDSQLLEFVHPADGLGYVLWDAISRNGRFRIVVAQRFLLQGEGGALPNRIAWSRLVEYFPIEQFRTHVQQSVPQTP